MQVDRTSNRWLVVLGSLLIQLSLGAIYAWSVFTPALRAAGWSKVDTQIVFAVGLVTFALTMVFSGRAISKLGPRKLVVIGGLMLGAGYALGGLNIIAGSVALSFEHYVIGGVGLGVGLLSAGMGIAAHSQPEVGAKSSPLVGVDLPRWIVAPTIFPSQSGAHGVGLGLRLALP